MKNGNISLNMGGLPAQAGKSLKKLATYKVFIFFLVVASFYGYIVWRINVYSNAPADQTEQVAHTTPQPRIDPETVKKIQSLQDNSVSVKAIFEQARKNPFQE